METSAASQDETDQSNPPPPIVVDKSHHDAPVVASSDAENNDDNAIISDAQIIIEQGGELAKNNPQSNAELLPKRHASSSSDGDTEIHKQPPPSPLQQKSKALLPPLPLDEERIDKAEAFLRNTEIRDVPTTDKRSYLESKIGISPGEIDAAMERVAERERMIMGGSDRQGDDGCRRRNTNQYYQDDSHYHSSRSSPRRGGDGPMPERRRPPPPPPPPQYPPTTNYNNNMPPPHNNNNNNMQPSQGAAVVADREQEAIITSSFLLPAWAGGFSLGIFCLAALRWLNGGDFVLFPPPTALESTRVMETTAVGSKQEEEELLLSINEEETTTDGSDSQQEEEEQQLQEDNAEYEEDESESNEEEDGLNMILNGTANAQNFHPDNTISQQPSYNELVLELRSLTSAIHSYRDVQERANRAVSAQVGKGVTDDAMDFLRQKKSLEGGGGGNGNGALSSSSGEKMTLSLDEKGISTMSLLLAEVSGDLSQLKQIISQVDNKPDNANNSDESPNDDNSDKPTGESKGASELDKSDMGEADEDPSNRIDKVVDKVQKILDIVNSGEPNEKGDVNSKEKENSGAHVVEEESNTILSTEPDAAGTPSPGDQADEKPQECEDPPQQPDNETTQTNEQLENALKTLANSNNSEDLKVGAQMLYLYCLNISKSPSIPRYRKIYTNNNTFRNKVGNLVGAKEFLSAVGFVERTSFFEWGQTTDDTSLDVKSRLDFALVALELMKNGLSKPNDDATPALPPESNVVASEAFSAAVSGFGKGMDLN